MLVRFQGLIQQVQLDGALLPTGLSQALQHFGAELIEDGQPDPPPPRIELRPLSGATTAQQRQLPPDQHHYRFDGRQVTLDLCDGRVSYDPAADTTVATLDSDCASGGLYALGAALTRALALQGAQVLHGAVFDYRGTVVAAIGPSGAGKSTLAMAALIGGAQLLADDMALLGSGPDGQPLLRALRPHLSLRESSLAMLPSDLRARLQAVDYAGETRWELDLAKAARRPLSVLQPQVLVLLRPRSGPDSSVAPVDTASALAGLISAASPLYLSAPHARERLRGLATLQQLAERCLCRQASVGSRLLSEPGDEFRRLLAALVDVPPA